MSQYIVSARKYRPDAFETLIGQDNISQTLKNSILRGQLAHAYLFCGPRGVGKTTTARIFAKAINCSNLSNEIEPCGVCESCQSFAEGRSYCIHELDAASNNGVDDIKALMDQVRIPPQVGRYSVYIIDEVHMLSQAAFNAFLKTLEEPPAHAIFILATTEKHKILPTILSRCQTYDFNRITVDNIVRQLRNIAGLEGITIDDESLHVIAVKADGAMRDALTIFDQTVAFCGTEVAYQEVLKNLNVLDYEYSFSLVENFLGGDHASALRTFDEILTKGFNALHFIAALSSHFRDLIVSKSGSIDALLELPESLKKKYKEQAERCALRFLYNALQITTACEAGYRASVNPRLHIEFALMKLCAMNSVELNAPMGAAPMATAPAATAQPAARPSGPVAPASPLGATPAAPAAAAPVAPTQPAPAQAPAPAQPAAPAPAPAQPAETARRTRAPRTAAPTLSLKAMAQKEDEDISAADLISPESVVLTDEQIKAKWPALAASYEGKPRLQSAISAAILDIEEANGEKTVVFKVFNSAQKEWIESKQLHEMEGRFQKITGSSVKLKIDVVAEAEQTETKAYMPADKAKELMSNNTEFRNLVTDLGLDIK